MGTVKLEYDNDFDNGYLFIYNLVKSYKKESINAISNFLDILIIDKDIINELENIDIYVSFNNEYKDKDWIAIHNTLENYIIINGCPLKNEYDYLVSSGKSLERIDFELKENICVTLIHEYLHSFRDFNFKYIEKSIDIVQYNELTLKYYDIINDKTDSQRKIISIIENSDDYILIIYDMDFEILTIPKESIDNLDKAELINNDLDFDDYFELLCLSSNDEVIYYNEYNDPINVCELNKDTNRGIEESIVAALSYIIKLHKNVTSFNYNIINKLKENVIYSDEFLLIGFIIASKMSIEDIKWFLTSFMEDEYRDRLVKLFRDNYDEILKSISETYNLLLEKNKEEYNSKFDYCLKLLK